MGLGAWFYVLVLILAVSAAYLLGRDMYGYGGNMYARNGQRLRDRICLAWLFALLGGVSAARIAVGNDYWVYVENFRLIYQGRHVSSEWGFNQVAFFMQWLFGYNAYLPIFGLFSLITVSLFLAAFWRLRAWMPGCIFLFLAGGYYFSSLNSLRYYLVLAVALFALSYLLEGRYMPFLLCICLGSLFHKSILVVIPLYGLAYGLASRPWKIWHSLMLALGGGIMVCFPQAIRKIIFTFYPFYENSGFDRGGISYANVVKCLLALGLAAWAWRRRPELLALGSANRVYAILQMFALILYLGGSFIPEVSRIGYYLLISQLLLLPSLARGLDRPGKPWMLTLVGLGYLLFFALFLQKAYAVDIRLLPYRTWLFH